VCDVEGVEHTVEVTAASLHEAVALGLRAIRKSDWADEIPQGLNHVTVSVTGVRVEHTVQLKKFNQWLARTGGSPADILKRNRIRELLEG